MNKIRFGVCHWCLPAEGPDACRAARELGLDGIELNFAQEIDEEPLRQKEVRRNYRNAANEWGIVYPTLGLNILCKYGMSKSESAGMVRKIYDQAIRTASDMEIPTLQVPSFANGEIHSPEEFRQTAENLRYACRAAKNEGIVIATENALSAGDNLKLLEETGCDNLKVYFDTQNPYLFLNYNVSEMVEPLKNVVIEIHAKDGKDGKMGSAYLGEGDAGFFATAEAFRKAGYHGWVLSENDYTAAPFRQDADRSFESIRKDLDVMKWSFT